MNRIIFWTSLFLIIAQTKSAQDYDAYYASDGYYASGADYTSDEYVYTEESVYTDEGYYPEQGDGSYAITAPVESVSPDPIVETPPAVLKPTLPPIVEQPPVKLPNQTVITLPPIVEPPPIKNPEQVTTTQPPPPVAIPQVVVTAPPPVVVLVVQPRQPAPVTFPVDFSTNEASIRTTIFQGNVQASADTMITSTAASIGAGLTYEARLSSLVEPSTNRNSDPDVVAFKALALAAVTTRDASRFGSAVVISFDQNGTTGIFTRQQVAQLVAAFTADFSNVTELNQIVSANANLNLGRRKLQLAGKSSVNSLACSSCWPQKQCKKVFWC